MLVHVLRPGKDVIHLLAEKIARSRPISFTEEAKCSIANADCHLTYVLTRSFIGLFCKINVSGNLTLLTV